MLVADISSAQDLLQPLTPLAGPRPLNKDGENLPAVYEFVITKPRGPRSQFVYLIPRKRFMISCHKHIALPDTRFLPSSVGANP